MAEHISFQPLLIHALEMEMQWLHVPGFHLRFIYFFLVMDNFLSFFFFLVLFFPLLAQDLEFV